MKRLSVGALVLLTACGPSTRPGDPPARPAYDVHQIASPDLLRQANRGRTIEGPDGRYVLPPSVRRAWIDVGAHLMEQTRAEMRNHEDVAVVAIEPLEECWKAWDDNPRLIALPVAISIERGFLDFQVNAEDSTSSLLKSVEGNSVSELTRTVQVRKVPVLRLEDVLERIPPNIEVEFLKTDVQGHDLQVLKSAGEQIRRIERVQVEIINEAIYEGTGDRRPGTEAEFVAYMAGKGFEFEGDSGVKAKREWLDKHFVNPQRQGFFARAGKRFRSWLP